jgi:tRNA 2-selenouridine synthase
MARRLSPIPFLNLPESQPVLDVRSPGEYALGHIPGAISFPLFSDEERAEVGTLYKQKGKDEALLKGLDFVGPKMSGFIRSALLLSPEKKVRIHCWRGGMRSGSMAWLLESAGFEVSLLEGGYKAFRREVLDNSPLPQQLCILGGFTGSRKTEVLQEIGRMGKHILDLEALACHKGSSFGNLGQPPQPRQEQFENEVYLALLKHPENEILWLEDESKAIGKLRIPDALHDAMRESRVCFVERSREERLVHIATSYGKESLDELKAGMQRIGKRLGGQALKEALEHLERGEISEAASLSLYYYDKAYGFGLSQRPEEQVIPFDCRGLSDREMAEKIAGKFENRFPA